MTLKLPVYLDLVLQDTLLTTSCSVVDYDLVCTINRSTSQKSKPVILNATRHFYLKKRLLTYKLDEDQTPIINPELNDFRRVKIQGAGSIPIETLLTLSCTSIQFEWLRDVLNLTNISSFRNISHVNFDSNGRFDRAAGYYQTVSLYPLKGLNLIVLEFTGPWFQDIIDSETQFFDFLTSFPNLQRLVADFDSETLSPGLLHTLFAKLPYLTEIGRLARVGRAFWRCFTNRTAAKAISKLEIGHLKCAYSHRIDANGDFLDLLAIGIRFAFPNLLDLKLYLGFQNIPSDKLLEICKGLKMGGANECRSTIRSICIYQMSGALSIRKQDWEYTSLVYGGGKTMKICLSDSQSLQVKFG